MSTYLTVATLPHLDGYARDDVKISACFLDLDDTPTRALQKMVDFFIVAQANAHKVGEYLSGTRSRAANACFVQAFDVTGKLDGTPHGSAVAVEAFTLPVSSNANNLPSEVAAVISMRASGYTAALEAGPEEAIPTPGRAVAMGAPATHVGRTRPRGRQRGRMFIGPLNQACVDSTDADKRARLDGTFRQTLGQAAAIMAAPGTPNDATAGIARLQVWSRRDEVTRAVTSVLVDDAFDIQRRRGEKFVARTSYAI